VHLEHKMQHLDKLVSYPLTHYFMFYSDTYPLPPTNYPPLNPLPESLLHLTIVRGSESISHENLGNFESRHVSYGAF
jgi:hypothetical protein